MNLYLKAMDPDGGREDNHALRETINILNSMKAAMNCK